MNFNLSEISKLKTAYLVLFFYAIIMNLSATIGWFIDKENGFTYGYVVGIVISVALWFLYGKQVSKV